MTADRSHTWPPALPWSTAPAGGRCPSPTGCTNSAAPGRYVCAAHAAKLERRARELRAGREDPQETRNRRRPT